MKRVCGWCKTEIGVVPSANYSEDVITHGICDECIRKLLLPFCVSLRDFLDTLDAPVLVVDSAGEVLSANDLARLMLHKELPDIESFKGGDVFECAFATLPEGCGRTVHCNGCTIRNTVMDTMQSGVSHVETPAFLFQGNPDNPAKIPFLISTEKVGDVVLLRIDKAGGT